MFKALTYLVIALVVTLLGLPAVAAPTQDEQQVQGAVQNFWSASRTLNWSGMEARMDFPFSSVTVGPHHAGVTTVYRDRQQFEAGRRNISALLKKGLKAEVIENQYGARISQLHAQILNDTTSFVTYIYQPTSDKTPYQLLTVLRKGRYGWKMVFSTLPW